MRSELRERAIKMRIDEQLSYTEIRKRLGVSKSTLSYWLKDFPLSEERILELRRQGWTKGEAARERYRNTMRKRKEEEADRILKTKIKEFDRTLKDQSVFTGGLMLYLAEGAKTRPGCIKLANTDPEVLLFFISWLKKFFNIEKERLKIELHLYENMNIAKEEEFWQNTLQLPKEQFYPPQIRKLRKGSFSYRGSHRHGTCGIGCSDIKKWTELMMGIKGFLIVAASRTKNNKGI